MRQSRLQRVLCIEYIFVKTLNDEVLIYYPSFALWPPRLKCTSFSSTC